VLRRAPSDREFEKLLNTPFHALPTARYLSAANRHNSFPHAGRVLSRPAAPPVRPAPWLRHSGPRGRCISGRHARQTGFHARSDKKGIFLEHELQSCECIPDPVLLAALLPLHERLFWHPSRQHTLFRHVPELRFRQANPAVHSACGRETISQPPPIIWSTFWSGG
jgi:hypothetical protein